MTRPAEDVRRVAQLLGEGLSQAEVARKTGVPRSTVQTWVRQGLDVRCSPPRAAWHTNGCHHVELVPRGPYAYLFGLYLGDGYVSGNANGVYRLRVALDQRYPAIIAACGDAMAAVLPNRVGIVNTPGCVHVSSYSEHWVCLLPQHATGRKHLRPIVLEPWQEQIVLDDHPGLFLRGLIHSDGYRGMNPIRGGRYAYPRYQFSNRSEDIRALFVEAGRRIGVEARRSNEWTVSVSRRRDVALLDTFIGPKC